MHYNMVNEIMNAEMSVLKPELGMVGTMFVGTDRYAMVVTEVFNDKKIRVDYISDEEMNNICTAEGKNWDRLPWSVLVKDHVRVNDAHTGWEGRGKIYSYRKNKRWMPEGQGCWGTCSIHLGKAENYRDPNF